MTYKILALDLETSPNVAHVWGLWQQNVSLSQLMESTEVICFGARWVGKRQVIFRSVHHDGKRAMLEELHRLLDEADAVMGWNSKEFDSRHMKRELLEAGFAPPSPYHELDLMVACKRQFRFPSNKLDYVAQRLGVGAKVKHEGHSLWVKCLAGDEDAWKRMKRYQIQDVNLLLDLYDRLRPWIPSHPNVALANQIEGGCPSCGGTNLQKRGVARTRVSVFQRFQCQDCGAWGRSTKRNDGATVVQA